MREKEKERRKRDGEKKKKITRLPVGRARNAKTCQASRAIRGSLEHAERPLSFPPLPAREKFRHPPFIVLLATGPPCSSSLFIVRLPAAPVGGLKGGQICLGNRGS